MTKPRFDLGKWTNIFPHEPPGALKLACIWPDSHIPYHSIKAFNLLFNVLSVLCPDEIVFIGDLADFYGVNMHGKHPGLLHLLQDEVEAVNKFMDTIDKSFPSAKKVLIEGNHEFRLERYIMANAPALFGYANTAKFLRVHERGWKFVPYGVGQIYQILGSKLLARHEPLAPNAKLSASRSMVNLTYGHIHRIEQAYAVSLEGHQRVNFCPGWLGDIHHKDIFGYIKGAFQWQLGFALVWVDPKTRNFYHQIVPILDDYSCIVNGKRYKA